METLSSPPLVTSPSWTDTLSAPAQTEIVSQAHPQQTAEYQPSFEPVPFKYDTPAAYGYIGAQPAAPMERAETLADVLDGKKIEGTPELAVLIPPAAEAHVDPNLDEATLTIAAIRDRRSTIYQHDKKYNSYKPQHLRTQEKARRTTRQRRVATLAAAAVMASSFGTPAAAAALPEARTAAVAAVEARPVGPEDTETKTIIKEVPILGISERQQKIIDSTPGLTQAQRKAVAKVTLGIHDVHDELKGVNPNVMMAQGLKETGYLTSTGARKDNNLFGMKGRYKGQGVMRNTWEQRADGSKWYGPQLFMKFPSTGHSFRAYISQMNRLPWYRDALSVTKGVPYKSDKEYLKGILNHDKPGQYAYATDQDYARSIVEDYIEPLKIHELTKIDTKKVAVQVKTPAAVPAAEQKAPAPVETRASKLAKMKAKIAAFAWPQYRRKGSKGATDMRGAYQAVMDKAAAGDGYLGGAEGVDCGAFVTAVMRESGADPNYNEKDGNTAIQLQYLKEHDDVNVQPGEKVLYHQIKPNEKLQPGDIAVKGAIGKVGHTFFYVGNSIDGLQKKNGKPVDFKGVLASASLGNRAPMASNDYSRGAYTWFRLK